MALCEYEQALVEVEMDDFLKRKRPPEDIRPQLDIGYKLEDQSVFIFEIRPHWKTGESIHTQVAKTIYSKLEGKWKLYWMRQDLKWYPYDPVPKVDSLGDWLKVVEKDEHGCFWG